MSDYSANRIEPAEFLFPKSFLMAPILTISTGTVAFGFPSPDQVDPNDWTRGTLTFWVPNLVVSSDHMTLNDVQAVVTPAAWDVVSADQTPGWGVDWTDSSWLEFPPNNGGANYGINVRAGIAAKTGTSELLRCSYIVFSTAYSHQ